MIPDESGSPGATPGTSPDPANDATSRGRSTPAGATPPGSNDEGATPDAKLGEGGERALDNERTSRREAERALTEARRRIGELEDAGKSETERALAQLKRAETDLDTHRTRVAELEAQLAERDLRELKVQVASEAGLPPKLATRLQGTDLRSLRADAKTMADDLEAGTPVGSVGVGRGGAASGTRREDMNTLIREAAGR